MTKEMRELLEQIKCKVQEATKAFSEAREDDAKKAADEADSLKGKYELAKRIYEASKSLVPDQAGQGDEKGQKAADGFMVLAKMLAGKTLDETEKALVTDGTSGENYLMPKDVDLAIREMRKQYKSAKDLVTVIPTDTMTGSFNFESGTPVGLSDLTDGDEVDSSGGPTFEQKTFSIKLYSKLIAVSKVLQGAERSGLMAYLNRWFVKNAILTENSKIFAALKTGKNAKALKGWAAFKTSINKDLDPDALIGASIATNQTGFDILDNEVDGMGRPILQANPASPTQKLFQGLPIEVFSDTQLPNVSGKAPMFYGSLDAGCYFIEKAGILFEASDDYLFGKRQKALMVTEAFDVIQADTGAYLYGTLEATPAPVAG